MTSVVYLAAKFHPDGSNRAHVEALLSVISAAGGDPVSIVNDVERWGKVKMRPTELMARSLAAIDQSRLLVVDLSEKGIGVGIECGYAHARDIPIVVTLPFEADLSGTLEGIATVVVRYRRVTDLDLSEILGL